MASVYNRTPTDDYRRRLNIWLERLRLATDAHELVVCRKKIHYLRTKIRERSDEHGLDQ